MAKVNAYRLRMEKPERRKVGPIVNPDNPDEVLEIEFQYLNDSMMLAALDDSDSLIEEYIGTPEKKTTQAMPVDFSGNQVIPSKRLFRLLSQLVLMQVQPEVERYDWKEFAFLQSVPWAWGPIMDAYNAMSTPKEKKVEVSTSEPSSSPNTTSTSTPNISLETTGSNAEDTAVSG